MSRRQSLTITGIFVFIVLDILVSVDGHPHRDRRSYPMSPCESEENDCVQNDGHYYFKPTLSHRQTPPHKNEPIVAETGADSGLVNSRVIKARYMSRGPTGKSGTHISKA